MSTRFFSRLASAVAALGVVVFALQLPAQQPPALPPVPQPQPAARAGVAADAQATVPGGNVQADTAADAQIEVLTRGPLHEAFATRAMLEPVAGVRVDQAPPQAIEEVPPSVRPAGDDVVWIPGYWQWDADAGTHIWVSGVYRHRPPGMRWVPGYWDEVDGGWHWMSGFWVQANVDALTYYGPPPASVERGPSSPSPGDGYFWASGCWAPYGGRWVWYPGYWAPYYPGYVWIGPHNVPTAAGYVHIGGFYDFGLLSRGMVFAPVRLAPGVGAGARVRFTPTVAINPNYLQFHLFAGANANTYFFGNYYDPHFAEIGIRPWYSVETVAGIRDPLFSYYAWHYGRGGSNYLDTLTRWNSHFATNVDLQPAVTLSDQLTLAQRHAGAKNLSHAMLGTSVDSLVTASPRAYARLSAQQVAGINANVGRLSLLSGERLKAEAAAGPLDLSAKGEVNGAANLNVAPLRLPTVNVPAVRGLPANPGVLLRSADRTAGGAISGAQRTVDGVTGRATNVVPNVQRTIPNVQRTVPNVQRTVPSVPRAVPSVPRVVPSAPSVPSVPAPSVPSLPGLPF